MTLHDKNNIQRSSNDLLPLHPSIKRALIGSVVFIGLFVLGIYWVMNGLVRTLGAISPGATEVSTSLEPYEIALRAQEVNYKPLRKDAPPVEWIIKIPRAFVVKEFGINGDPYNSDGEGSFYSVYLDGVIGKDKTAITPAVLASNKSVKNSFMRIKLENTVSLREIFDSDLCIDQDDLNEMIKKAGGSGPVAPFTYCGTKCTIETHYRGWEMRITVAKDSEWHRNPQQACTIAKDFLIRNTVKIDALHTK
jgi:hypothetical protein